MIKHTALSCSPSLLVLALAIHGAQLHAETALSADTLVRVAVPARLLSIDPSQFIPEDSPIFNPQLASSCEFLALYSVRNDPVTRRYMREFAPTTGSITDTSPYGDASVGINGGAMGGGMLALNSAGRDSFGYGGTYGCSDSDARAAAGHNYIVRKDTTLRDGISAFQEQDYPKAIEQLQIAYKKIGYPVAGVLLGRIYLNNLGGRGDIALAIDWYKKVAEERLDVNLERETYDPEYPAKMSPRVEAYLSLAQIYMLGQGVPKNPAEARKWYAKASDIDYSPATNMLATAYLTGYGGSKDAKKALALYKKAGEEGDVSAQYNAGRIFYEGAEGVPRDLKAAGAWLSTAARYGHSGAVYAVGHMLDAGEGIAANPAKALVYYKAASLSGNPAAQNAMANYFYKGEVVRQDLPLARLWFEQAARQGEPDAMHNLAVMTSKGEGGQRDLATAYAWLVLARHAGHAVSKDTLEALRAKLSEQEKAKADAILGPIKS